MRILVCLLLGLFVSTAFTGPVVNKKVPNITIADLQGKPVNIVDFTSAGKVTVLSFWATWCKPCVAEHEVLMRLVAKNKVNIYGIAWKDKPEDTIAYLKKHGNPYQQEGSDVNGITTLPMVLTGVPETFVLDRKGAIRWHYRAELTDDIVNESIIPLVDKLNAANAPARK